MGGQQAIAPVMLVQPPILIQAAPPAQQQQQQQQQQQMPVAPIRAPQPAPSFDQGIASPVKQVVSHNLPEELLVHVIKLGLGREAVLRLEAQLQERGIPPDDVVFILRQFLESARPPSPIRGGGGGGGGGGGAGEQHNHPIRPPPAAHAGGPASDAAELQRARSEIDMLRRELEKSKQIQQKLEQDQKEIEQQVLGGFSFETWKKVQKLSLDQGKPSECVVCLVHIWPFLTPPLFK
jgi:hypothetical protein